MNINGKTRLLGVIGYPIEHTLSPAMHNAAIAALQLNYVYLPWPIQPTDLETALAGFAAIGVQGFNVTIPHKQAILPFLQEITPVAQAVGAVNTVWRGDRGWHGTNTDVVGFLAPLAGLQRSWTEQRVVVLGNGGAARAVIAGCEQLGCPLIQVVGRDRAKLQRLLSESPTLSGASRLSVHLWETLPDLLPQAGLVVNTTPIGMAPNTTLSPLPDDWLKQLQPATIVYDLIYNPRPTQLLQQADRLGMVALDGLEMLVQQGATALSLWLQKPAPIAVMREALRQTLQHLA